MDIQLATKTEQPIALTPAAIQRVKYLIAKKGGDNLGLRVAVKGGGCSGLSYVLSLEDLSNLSNPSFTTYQVEDVTVIVDPKSARFITGTTIDFSTKNLLEGGWIFNNPNAQRSCGCGTSFTPKS